MKMICLNHCSKVRSC